MKILWYGGVENLEGLFSQNKDGRDHNPRGFTVFLAGGGIKPGISYGSTDEIGGIAVENRVHMHDLHATILYALGLIMKDLHIDIQVEIFALLTFRAGLSTIYSHNFL